jgi:RNA polymerase sigma-70 factor (ECF subfamily)
MLRFNIKQHAGNLLTFRCYIKRMIFYRRNTETKSQGRENVGALYDRHASWLLAVCLRYTGNREDAEDVLHDGFMKIIGSFDSFKQTGSLEGWMRKIMVNTALNYIRNHKKERIFTSLEPDSDIIHDPSEQDDFTGNELSGEQLMEMICSLPVGYRTVFNLYVMENHSHREISEMLGITENTSKSQLSKARAYLRKRLLDCQTELTYGKTTSYR